MDNLCRKRLRSEEDSPWVLQHKILVNQKIVDLNDNIRMKAVHEKTVRQLFSAAQKLCNKSPIVKPLPQWCQFILRGDGSINFYPNIDPIDLPVERRKAECCGNRQIYIQELCSTCSFTLCEECGFSCGDCGRFLCRSCVTLFGCGTSDHPICEKCTMFN